MVRSCRPPRIQARRATAQPDGRCDRGGGPSLAPVFRPTVSVAPPRKYARLAFARSSAQRAQDHVRCPQLRHRAVMDRGDRGAGPKAYAAMRAVRILNLMASSAVCSSLVGAIRAGRVALARNKVVIDHSDGL